MCPGTLIITELYQQTVLCMYHTTRVNLDYIYYGYQPIIIPAKIVL